MSERMAGRLPEAVRPSLYQIQLTVIPQTRVFSGEVSIAVDIHQSCAAVILHALDLEISKAEIETQGKTSLAQILCDPASETVALTTAQPLPVGLAEVRLSFTGKLNTQLRGLYAAVVKDETYAFTQFEATDARRMFPCFDEPAMKARFQLTVHVPAHLVALSNMPILTATPQGDLKTVVFGETPLMSTYLLALAVARLESRTIQVGATTVSAWTVPGQRHLSEFSLRVTAGVLPLLNHYFDLPYPYPKLDLVGVPDFAMGAMENWGAIFFRDARMLVDEALTSPSTLRDVANVITHEIVHQWFGNLVTMIWWDDLWLNEAFATWLAVKIVDQWKPEWNSWIEFQQEKPIPLTVDALKNTRPIRADVTSAAQIEEMFDALTYEKGAACLRMIEQFLGELPFREGIRQYIRRHQYENVASSALWSALSSVSGEPVDAIAKDWFTQAGFPQVTLSATGPEANVLQTLRIAQKRFYALDQAGASESVWSVPLILKYRDTRGVLEYPVLLREASTQITLPAVGKVAWVYGNAKEAGFFRMRYDAPLQSALFTEGTASFSPEERIGMLNHLWAQTLRTDQPVSDFMNILEQFSKDRTRVVIQDITAYLETLFLYVVAPEDQAKLSQWIRKFYLPLWKALGWDPKTGEDEETRMTRASVLKAMGMLARDEDVLSELPRRQKNYWVKPESLDPTLATLLMRLCAQTDSGSQFDLYLKKFETAGTPEERDRYLLALSDFKKPDLTERLLSYALSDAVRSQDAWKPMRYTLLHPEGQKTAWTFVKAHWGALRQKVGSVGSTRTLQSTKCLLSPTWRAEVETFFNAPENHVEAATRALAQTLELMDMGIRFKTLQRPLLSAFLKAYAA